MSLIDFCIVGFVKITISGKTDENTNIYPDRIAIVEVVKGCKMWQPVQ